MAKKYWWRAREETERVYEAGFEGRKRGFWEGLKMRSDRGVLWVE